MKNTLAKNSNIVYCDHCHAELPLRARFCSVCGVCIENTETIEDTITTTAARDEDKTITQRIALLIRTPPPQSLVSQKLSNVAHSIQTLPGELEPEIEAPTIPETPAIPTIHGKKVEATDTRQTQGLQLISMVTSKAITARMAFVLCVVGLVTLFIHGYHLSTAPDIFSDEGVYLLVGNNIAKGLGLIVDHGAFLWHPPGYMIAEAIYIRLTGLTNADPLTAVLSVRYLNVFFSACTAILLVLFGQKLHSYKAGLFTAALFIMDPYVQRINRRSMIETLAMLCVLLGLYIFFTRRPHLARWQCLATGVAFGLAVLTKEPMFLELLALIIYVVLFRRRQLRDVLWVAAIASALYILYPLWAVASGQWNDYLAYKLFNVSRIIDSITNRQPTHPPAAIILAVSTRNDLLNSLWGRLNQYGTSYLLVALSALFTGLLILRYRHLIAARFLISWSIFSLGFGLILGRVSDQYFYYLVVPSIVVSGYVLASLFETVLLPSFKKASITRKGHLLFSVPPTLCQVIWRTVFAVFCVMLLYNGFAWTKTYALGSDDAYMQIVRYIKTNIPAGASLEASDDVAVYYLSPSYVVYLDRDTQSIMSRHVRYFIMSSKDATQGFDDMTPQLYTWVLQNSSPLVVLNDSSFGKIGLYQLTAPTALNDDVEAQHVAESPMPSHPNQPTEPNSPLPIVFREEYT